MEILPNGFSFVRRKSPKRRALEAKHSIRLMQETFFMRQRGSSKQSYTFQSIIKLHRSLRTINDKSSTWKLVYWLSLALSLALLASLFTLCSLRSQFIFATFPLENLFAGYVYCFSATSVICSTRNTILYSTNLSILSIGHILLEHLQAN